MLVVPSVLAVPAAALAALPVMDAPNVTMVIAWPPHSRSLALAGLIRTAARLTGGSAG
ncbi:hypothetical protein [Micromonospora zamorensis]|uniref:hypothetical protein n=1 Tax=Micromonospora zamorensis TaxID=709883 RepID=UPI0033BBCC47